MSVPKYPRGLPYVPLAEGYSEPVRPVIVKTDVEWGGPGRMRQKRSLPVKRRAYRLGMKRSQLVEFLAWHEKDLGNGASRFRMPVRNAKGFFEKHEVQFENGEVDPVPAGWLDGEEYFEVGFVLEVFQEIPRDEED